MRGLTAGARREDVLPWRVSSSSICSITVGAEVLLPAVGRVAAFTAGPSSNIACNAV